MGSLKKNAQQGREDPREKTGRRQVAERDRRKKKNRTTLKSLGPAQGSWSRQGRRGRTAPHVAGEIGIDAGVKVESPKHAEQCSGAIQVQHPKDEFPKENVLPIRGPEKEDNDEAPGGTRTQDGHRGGGSDSKTGTIHLEAQEDRDHPSQR